MQRAAVARAPPLRAARLDEPAGVDAALGDRGADRAAQLATEAVEVLDRQLGREARGGDPGLPQRLVGEQVADA
jgi:hypothetical protein